MAALGHRVARVDDEVHDHLFELVEIRLHEPKIAAVLDVEIDLLADEAAHEHLQIGEHV